MPIRPFKFVPVGLRDWSRYLSSVKIQPDPDSVGTVELRNGQVTYIKMQEAPAVSVLGRSANTIGTHGDIAAASNGLYLGRSADALAFQQIKSTEVFTDRTAAEIAAGVTPTAFQYPPSVDERRFGAAFPGDPAAVASVLASIREEDIPRIPVGDSVAAALRPLVSYEDRTVYIDPDNGDDSNSGLTTGDPLATIQEAVSRCPIFLYHLYQIDLITALPSPPSSGSPVVYDEDVLVTNMHCFTRGTDPGFISENFQIVGVGVAPADPSAVKVGSVTVVGCHGLAAAKIQGLLCTRVSPIYEEAEAIAIYGGGEIFVRNVAFDAAVGAAGGAGIRCYGARGSLREINCDNVTNGCWAKRSASVVCSDFTGTPSAQTYRSEEASTVVVIEDDTDTGTDPRDKYVTNGGVIRDLIGNMLMVGREFYLGLPKDASLALADVLGDDTVALGYNFHAPADHAVLIGSESEATGARDIVAGYDANATADDVIIVASGVNVSTAGVALFGKPGTNFPIFGLSDAVTAGAIPNEAAHIYIDADGAFGIQARDSGGTLRTVVLPSLSGSAGYDPPSLADGVGATTTVTVTGAAVGDYAQAAFNLDLQGIMVTAWVSAADTVSVRFQNETGGTIDLNSGTLRAIVSKA